MPKAIDPRFELLPGQLRPVAELCGVDGVELLVEHFGGTRLYVRRDVDSPEIAEKCGPRVAAALREYYGGDYVVLPLARALETARKHQAIRSDPRPANAVARELRMSVNSVHRIRGKRAPAAAPKIAATMARRRDASVIDLEEMIDRVRRR